MCTQLARTGTALLATPGTFPIGLATMIGASSVGISASVGDLIRSSLSDTKMRKYTQMGIPGDCYIFRIDENAHVDATMAGNIARFMNHSCAPNSYSRIVECGKAAQDKHIVIFAARDLKVGEELQYDYQFALGSSSEKIACYCGAPNCWGRMN